MIDAGYLLKKLYKMVGYRHPTSEEVTDFADRTIRNDENLFRIYFYDCPPLEESTRNPIDRSLVDFSKSKLCRLRKSLHDSLSKSDHTAFRSGKLQFNGWIIPHDSIKHILNHNRMLVPTDVKPEINQKRIDMKIGLDVAWLATKKIIDRIILITADTDFIPAMKFARREGVQVILAIPDKMVSQDILKHTDELRVVRFPESV